MYGILYIVKMQDMSVDMAAAMQQCFQKKLTSVLRQVELSIGTCAVPFAGDEIAESSLENSMDWSLMHKIWLSVIPIISLDIF